MSKKIRKTGIDFIGDVPRGTHFCQFYKTKKDLIDILVPYFKAGLENNEFCMWVTSKPLSEKDAAKALAKVLPDLDSYLKKGQIEIIPHDKCYLKNGVFNSQRVFKGLLKKLDKAMTKGYDGLRFTGNTSWLRKKDWRSFTNYEKEVEVDNVIGEYNIIALCTYSLDKCKANEVIDVVQNHQFVLIKREGKWEIIESSEHKRSEDEIKRFASFPQLNPNPVLEVDSSGIIVFCNAATIQTLRKLNLRDTTLFLPNDVADILKALEQEKEIQFYREVKIKDRIFGEVLYLTPQFDSIRIYANDITERKSYQEALQNALHESRQHEKEMSALSNASRAILKYSDFKSAAREIFDYCKQLIGATSGYIALLSKDGTENEVLFLDSGGLPCSVDPGLPMPIRGLRGEAYNNLKTVYDNDFHQSEWMKFMPEGHVRLENVLFAPMVVEGKAVGLLGIANKPGGFTENDARIASAFAELAAIALTQKNAEEALRHSEEYFRVVTENALDVITILDSNGTIHYESQSVEQVLGYKQKELMGKSAFDLIHPDDLANVRDAFSQIIQKPGITLSAEFRCRHKDGSWRVLGVRGRNLLEDPVIRGIIINAHDITYRKQAEEALLHERKKLVNILDSMEDGVYIVNQQYDIEYVNPLLEKEYGPLNGRKCHEYFEGRKKACTWCKNQEVFKGKTVRWEWYSEKTNKTYDLINTPLKNPDGSVSKLGIFRDITERKKIEETLRESRKDLDRAQEVGQIGSWRMDVRRNVLTWSDENHRIFGIPKGIPMAYETFLSIVHPDDREYVDTKWKAGLAGENYDIEHRIVVDGKTKWVRERAYLEFDKNGELLGGFGITQDITQRKISEEALRKSEARYRSYLEVTGQVGWTTDADGLVVEDMPAWRQYTGQSREEIQVWGWSKVLHPDDLERTSEIWRKAVQEKRTYETEYRLRRHDGVYRHFLARGVPTFNEDGSIREWVGTCIDITERKHMEEELRRSYDELEIRVRERTLELNEANKNLQIEIQERKKAEESVRTERQRLYSVLGKLPAYVCLLTPNYTFAYVNQEFRRIFGDPGNRQCYEFLFGIQEPCEGCQTYKIFSEHKNEQKWEWVGPNGNTYAIYDYAFTDVDGSPLILEMGLDITDRKKALERMGVTSKLLEFFITKNGRKEYLDSVVDVLHEWTQCNCIGIRILDKQGNIPYESYTGFSQEFWEAENWISVKNHQCACIRVVLQKPDSQDVNMMTPNGSFHCNNTETFAGLLTEDQLSRYRGLCIRTGFKSVAIVPIIYKDTVLGALHIADRREGMVPLEKIEFIESVTPMIGEAIFRFSAEEALSESKERYRMLVETMNEGMGVDDENGLLVYANDRLCEMLGYSQDEIIGRPVLSFFDRKNQNILREQIEARNRGETEPYRLEWKKKDGQKIITLVSPRAIVDDDGNYRGSFAVITDITEKLKLESIAEAVNMMNNIGYIFSGIRHEIGNPVNSIKMALSVLKQNIDSYTTDMVKEYADRMLSEVLRLEYLLKAMKNFNMYETVELMDTDMTDFMNKFLSLVVSDFEKKGIKVDATVTEPSWVYADPRALQQVLLNIMTNASDALEGRENPRIAISVSKAAGMVDIRIEDNGGGMTEDQQEDLFKPFYTNKAKGTGLGLVIAKKMLTKMKGFIELVSEKDEGTIVDLFIPEGISEKT